jgi:hypothetical protein
VNANDARHYRASGTGTERAVSIADCPPAGGSFGAL